MVPSTGSPAPMMNQIKNELPLILPITPAESPQKKIRTRNCVMALEEAVEGPEDADHRCDGDDRPRDRRHDADHDLEQHVRGNHQNPDGEGLAADVRECSAAALLDVLAHESIVAGGRARRQGIGSAMAHVARPWRCAISWCVGAR